MIRSIINNYLDRGLHNLASFTLKFPYVYLIIISVFALFGYGMLLLFPLLIFYGIGQLEEFIRGFENIRDGLTIVCWLVVISLSCLLTYRLIFTRPKPPAGIKLNHEDMPELFMLIEELQNDHLIPSIKSVMINDNFGLEIIKTPVTGFPLWSTNTLMLGLPLMLSLSPRQFEIILNKTFCQFSIKRNPLTNWLFKLRQIWPQYRDTYARKRTADYRFLYWMLFFYSSIYNLLSIYAARIDHLSAERYTLSYVNDQDMLDSIESCVINQMFLDNLFWPKIRNIANKEKKYNIMPHVNMAKVLKKALTQFDTSKWLQNALIQPQAHNDPAPSFACRLENIGHSHLTMPDFGNITAADKYFESKYKETLLKVDKLWQMKFIPRWKMEDDLTRTKESLMKALSKMDSSFYTFSALWKCTILALRIGHRPAYSRLLKLLFTKPMYLSKKKLKKIIAAQKNTGKNATKEQHA